MSSYIYRHSFVLAATLAVGCIRNVNVVPMATQSSGTEHVAASVAEAELLSPPVAGGDAAAATKPAVQETESDPADPAELPCEKVAAQVHKDLDKARALVEAGKSNLEELRRTELGVIRAAACAGIFSKDFAAPGNNNEDYPRYRAAAYGVVGEQVGIVDGVYHAGKINSLRERFDALAESTKNAPRIAPDDAEAFCNLKDDIDRIGGFPSVKISEDQWQTATQRPNVALSCGETSSSDGAKRPARESKPATPKSKLQKN